MAKRKQRKAIQDLAQLGDQSALAKQLENRLSTARRSQERRRKQLLLVASEQGREPTRAEVMEHEEQLLIEFADFALVHPEMSCEKSALERWQQQELHVDAATHTLATRTCRAGSHAASCVLTRDLVVAAHLHFVRKRKTNCQKEVGSFLGRFVLPPHRGRLWRKEVGSFLGRFVLRGGGGRAVG